jgi:MFS family permease
MIVTYFSSDADRAAALSRLGFSYGIGMVAGPTIGGYVTKAFGYANIVDGSYLFLCQFLIRLQRANFRPGCRLRVRFQPAPRLPLHPAHTKEGRGQPQEARRAQLFGHPPPPLSPRRQDPTPAQGTLFPYPRNKFSLVSFMCPPRHSRYMVSLRTVRTFLNTL